MKYDIRVLENNLQSRISISTRESLNRRQWNPVAWAQVDHLKTEDQMEGSAESQRIHKPVEIQSDVWSNCPVFY